MELIGYLDIGYEWFSKGLEVVREIIIKIASFLPLEERLALAIVFLAVSIFSSYKIVGSLTIHPFSTKNIIYLLVIAWLIFTILFYLTIGAPI